MLIATQVFSSLGVGFLVGILLGLSSAPVVGLLVGSLTALLASLLGFKLPTRGDADSDAPLPREIVQTLIGLRAGTFGFACVLGIFVGIFMRTHDVLSPPEPGLEERYAELLAIGFSQEEARSVLIGGGASAGSPASTPTTRNTVLFGIDAALCQQLAPDRFATLAAAADYYRGRDLAWLADITRELDNGLDAEGEKRLALNAVVRAACRDD